MQVWMNDVTVQGNGGEEQGCEWCGMVLNGAHVYAQGASLYQPVLHTSSSPVMGVAGRLST
jgi:hypothetical protein